MKLALQVVLVIFAVAGLTEDKAFAADDQRGVARQKAHGKSNPLILKTSSAVRPTGIAAPSAARPAAPAAKPPQSTRSGESLTLEEMQAHHQ